MTASIASESSDPARLAGSPLVSVLMITYNHGPYLAEAIEGVLAQQCDFPFELIIGEDASADNTLEVALDYQKRFPEVIRVIHSERNVGANANARRIFDRARGRYIAYCEGDDFWCARDKLARQVAMIEGDTEIGAIHSDWARCRLHNDTWHFDADKSVHRRVADRYLGGNIFATWHYPKVLRTCTILLRRETMQACFDSGLGMGQYRFGDSVRNAFVSSAFKIGYLPAVTAVYRVSPNSVLRSGARQRVLLYESCLEFDTAARAYLAGRASYGEGYRWESAASLLLWGMRARDFRAVRKAANDFRLHFSIWSFFETGLRSIAMRLPTLRSRPRDVPGPDGMTGSPNFVL